MEGNRSEDWGNHLLIGVGAERLGALDRRAKHMRDGSGIRCVQHACAALEVLDGSRLAQGSGSGRCSILMDTLVAAVAMLRDLLLLPLARLRTRRDCFVDDARLVLAARLLQLPQRDARVGDEPARATPSRHTRRGGVRRRLDAEQRAEHASRAFRRQSRGPRLVHSEARITSASGQQLTLRATDDARDEGECVNSVLQARFCERALAQVPHVPEQHGAPTVRGGELWRRRGDGDGHRGAASPCVRIEDLNRLQRLRVQQPHRAVRERRAESAAAGGEAEEVCLALGVAMWAAKDDSVLCDRELDLLCACGALQVPQLHCVASTDCKQPVIRQRRQPVDFIRR